MSEDIQIQLKKGVLELCVLALLSPFIPGLFSEPPPPKPVAKAGAQEEKP